MQQGYRQKWKGIGLLVMKLNTAGYEKGLKIGTVINRLLKSRDPLK